MKDKKHNKTIKDDTKDKTINPKEAKHKSQKEAYILSLVQGSSHKEATEAAQTNTTTVWEWKQKDPDFAKAITVALESRIKVVEDALYATATGKEGKAKVIAQIFWLKNRGKNWKDKQDIEFKAPVIVKQNTFIQAGEAPKVIEEVNKEVKSEEKQVDSVTLEE